jgi:Ca2+-binding EF-hand superfamily protein
MSLPDHISFQMVSFYGMKSIAARYLQELYVGLVQRRTKHPRLSLFGRALQVFPEDDHQGGRASLGDDAYQLVLGFMRQLLALLELERLVTRASSLMYFSAYGQMCTLFVPVEYVARAAEAVHEGDELFHSEVAGFVATLAEKMSLPDEAACAASAARNEITHRATVLGASIEGARFLDCDHLLDSLASVYTRVLEGRAKMMDESFARYDTDGDGKISLGEFGPLLADVHDLEAYPISHDETAQLYANLIALGNGKICASDLGRMLHAIRQRHRMARMPPPSLEIGTSEAQAAHEFELRELSNDWDMVRMSTSEHPLGSERVEHFERCVGHIVRLQRVWMRRLKRIRETGGGRRWETEAPSRCSVMALLGM